MQTTLIPAPEGDSAKKTNESSDEDGPSKSTLNPIYIPPKSEEKSGSVKPIEKNTNESTVPVKPSRKTKPANSNIEGTVALG